MEEGGLFRIQLSGTSLHPEFVGPLNQLLGALINEGRIKRIEIQRTGGTPLNLNPQLYTYKKLVKLVLRCPIMLLRSTKIALPAVETLVLWLSSTDDSPLARWMEGCPSLVDLTVIGTMFLEQPHDPRVAFQGIEERGLVFQSTTLERATIISSGTTMSPYGITFKSCRSLKSVSLTDGDVVSKWSPSPKSQTGPEFELFAREYGMRVFKMSWDDMGDLLLYTFMRNNSEVARGTNAYRMTQAKGLRIARAPHSKDRNLILHVLKCVPELKKLTLYKEDRSAKVGNQEFDLSEDAHGSIQQIDFNNFQLVDNDKEILKYLILKCEKLKEVNLGIDKEVLEQEVQDFVANEIIGSEWASAFDGKFKFHSRTVRG